MDATPTFSMLLARKFAPVKRTRCRRSALHQVIVTEKTSTVRVDTAFPWESVIHFEIARTSTTNTQLMHVKDTLNAMKKDIVLKDALPSPVRMRPTRWNAWLIHVRLQIVRKVLSIALVIIADAMQSL
jgi:hypothetical protein